MARLHLTYKDFKPETLEATEKLFAAKPWTVMPNETKQIGQEWLNAVCSIYEVPQASLKIGASRARHTYFAHEVLIRRWSIFRLFKSFRHYVLRNNNDESLSTSRTTDDDAHRWAASLFYTVRPHMFRARVREGRIKRIEPDDLLSSETLRLRTEMEEAQVHQDIEENRDAGFADLEISESSALDQINDLIAHSSRAHQREIRIAAHNNCAGENVADMNVRPLRKYATSVGLSGAWSMTASEIKEILSSRDDLAENAVRLARVVRSQLGTG